MRNGIQVPRGKVKFYDAEKGFGFILDDEDGQSVYVHATTLPEGSRPASRRPRRVRHGRRPPRPQVLSLQLLEPAPSVARARRQKPEDLAGMVEDLIRLLDDAGTGLRHGRYPDRGHSQKIATVLRAVADNFEA